MAVYVWKWKAHLQHTWLKDLTKLIENGLSYKLQAVENLFWSFCR